MLEVDLPGRDPLRLQHLVLDFNGTLACDGVPYPGVAQRLQALARVLEVHVVTGDTFGSAADAVGALSCRLVVLPADRQAEAKLAYVEKLGCERAVCIGNGHNDRLMLGAAALSIAVIQAEGAAQSASAAAQIACRSIDEALDLLVHPRRITATLRA